MMMMNVGGNNQATSTQNEDGGSREKCGGGDQGGLMLKKGPWTAAEDSVLADYVRTHGEGNWNAVQKNTGLARCGKSCRLRWANHLRPNLKKGSFNPDEERIIVELHAKMGNKWARMATQLPGRTDNEIKNYWNTRVKRRQRQGLPLYPPDIQPLYPQNNHHPQPISSSTAPLSPSTSSFSFHTPTSHHHHTSMLNPPSPHSLHLHNHYSSQPLLNNNYQHPSTPPPQQLPQTPPPYSPSPSTPPYTSPLPSPHSHRPSFPTLPLFDSSTSNNNNNTPTTSTSDFFFPRPSSPFFLQAPLRYKRFRPGSGGDSADITNNIGLNGSSNNNNTSSFMFPLSPLLRSVYNNPHTAAATSSSPMSPTPANYTSSFSLDPVTLDLASSARILGSSHFDPGQFISTPGYVYPLKPELPSNQFLSQDGNSDVVSLHNKGNNTTNNNYSSNNNDNDHHENQQHNLSMHINGSSSGLLEDMLGEAQALAANNDMLRRGFISSSDQGFSSVYKAREETPDQQMNTTNDDYTGLLNVVPSSMAMPEWYSDSGEGSNGQSSVITDDNLGLEMHHIANSLLPVDIGATDLGKTSSSRSWDNLPGIC